MTPRRRWPIALVAMNLAMIAHGQPRPATPADRVLGADSCIRCHREPTDLDRRPGGATEFIRLDESTVWQKQDLHARAFEALSGELGQRMGRALGYDATKGAACLACHAVDLMPEKAPREKVAADFSVAFGVGCEACHGFAAAWNTPHARPAWRDVPPAEKWQKFGQIDIRDPVIRAERCAACHVGNAAEGKFVTHAMYAAGHPPLPPLEVATFSRDQQMHYVPGRANKYLNSLPTGKAESLFHHRADESQPARLVAVGAVVTFREAMRSLAHAATEAGSTGAMLDFAHFDCAACHHDLRFPSWRQTRPQATTPGRPLPNTGPTALLRAVVRHAGAEGDFAAKYLSLMKAFDARPFGEPARIGPAAAELVKWSDSSVRAVGGVRYTAASTRALSRAIATAASGDSPGLDFDNAQQLLWAFDVLRDECRDLPAVVGTEVAALGGGPMLGRLKVPDQPRPMIVEELPARLRRVGAFDPAAFRSAFAKIAAALGPER